MKIEHINILFIFKVLRYTKYWIYIYNLYLYNKIYI